MDIEMLIEDKLDELWITDFEKIDDIYSEYYKSDIYFVKITCLYVDKENDLFKIKEEVFFMQNPNIISRDELISIIKKNSILNNKRFSLLSLLKYNINIEPQNVKYFLTSSDNFVTDYDNNEYITILKNIDEIEFDKTINMYHDLNNVIVIYYEKNIENQNNLNNSYHNNNNNNNNTKKVYLHKNVNNSHKKTIRR
jgi:hypothetical protein